MILQSVAVGITMTNCYLVGCEQTHEGVVIDPGGHPERILKAVEESGLTVRYVLNTHCHFDHMAANADVVAATGHHHPPRTYQWLHHHRDHLEVPAFPHQQQFGVCGPTLLKQRHRLVQLH